MKQMFFADTDYACKRKHTCRECFLINLHYPKGEGGCPVYSLMALLRVHLMQNWFGYGNPTMEEALYETTILNQFSGLHLDRLPVKPRS
jgi:IS5 family transposase